MKRDCTPIIIMVRRLGIENKNTCTILYAGKQMATMALFVRNIYTIYSSIVYNNNIAAILTF